MQTYLKASIGLAVLLLAGVWFVQRSTQVVRAQDAAPEETSDAPTLVTVVANPEPGEPGNRNYRAVVFEIGPDHQAENIALKAVRAETEKGSEYFIDLPRRLPEAAARHWLKLYDENGQLRPGQPPVVQDVWLSIQYQGLYWEFNPLLDKVVLPGRYEHSAKVYFAALRDALKDLDQLKAAPAVAKP
ncbi:MAG: hypothetical protein QM770_02700 [Tepidisphaeraceae bacterium]